MEKSWIILCISHIANRFFSDYSQFIYPWNSYFQPLCNTNPFPVPSAHLSRTQSSLLAPLNILTCPILPFSARPLLAARRSSFHPNPSSQLRMPLSNPQLDQRQRLPFSVYLSALQSPHPRRHLLILRPRPHFPAYPEAFCLRSDTTSSDDCEFSDSDEPHMHARPHPLYRVESPFSAESERDRSRMMSGSSMYTLSPASPPYRRKTIGVGTQRNINESRADCLGGF